MGLTQGRKGRHDSGTMTAPKLVPAPSKPSPLAVAEVQATQLPSEGQPWSRLPREGDAAWSAFLAYRDMAYPEGPAGRFATRNMRALSDALGVRHDYLRHLSSSFNWADRAGSYDRALDMAKTEMDLSEVQRVRQRHLRLLAKARTFAEMELDKMVRRASDPDISTASAREVKDLLEFAIKTERLLLGEHTDHLKLDGEWDLEDLSLEDLEALEEIRKKAKGGG